MMVHGQFREQALAGRTQREQIDHLLKVTAPSERIVIMAIGAIVIGLFVWLTFGAVPHTISTEGVVLETPPPRAVVSGTGGRLTAWLVAPGDRIEAGAPVARLAFPELDARIASLRNRAKAMQDAVGDDGDMQALALAATRTSSVSCLTLCVTMIADVLSRRVSGVWARGFRGRRLTYDESDLRTVSVAETGALPVLRAGRRASRDQAHHRCHHGHADVHQPQTTA